MCDLLKCEDCIHRCKNNATDAEVEKLWQEFEDVPVCINEEFQLCLDIDWNGWKKGTDICSEIWPWFHQHHSQGIGWLMDIK